MLRFDVTLMYVRRSREGAWIEINGTIKVRYNGTVAPARERGLKYYIIWNKSSLKEVAPARERGLKFIMILLISQLFQRRSREGAWIEIC